MKWKVILLVCCLVLPVGAQAKERHAAAEFGLGTAAVICTIGYGTAKFLYATIGSLIGGGAYLITGGRGDVARAIIQPAVRGDYVVSPEHLTSERALVFTGRDPHADTYQY